MISLINQQDQQWIVGLFNKLSVKMGSQNERIGSLIPHILENNHYKELDSPDGISWWANGFWPGMLWQMYNATKEEAYKQTAEKIQQRLDQAFTDYD